MQGNKSLLIVYTVGGDSRHIKISFHTRPDALPDVNHMRGMPCQIVQNKIFWSEIN